ncbi:uncharacterized protein B0T15DRAFT_394169 [Chaetomium strumarium]|uniref:Protein HRI1 n=1 Tax=Chaetomium strumarium TaxID=1170767 RepID=A0AAJ0M347_9PEZI|nr:hypothetical protein B0T15DRAFT_394169 [Chaetomium strumarium]
MCDISVREYIRWLPDEPSEPTSTIVLTTPERRFVDIRVLKDTTTSSSNDASGDAMFPVSRLDWAIAGTSESSLIMNGTRHGRWHHWIDSRSKSTEGLMDEGDMFDHPSDPTLTLERGRMVNPLTGAETDYEEMWRSEPIESTTAPSGPDRTSVTCLALQWQGAEDGDPPGKVRRGLVVRLGQYCQAFARDGDEITVERLKWDVRQQMWARQVRIGKQELPLEVATYFAPAASIDDEVKVGGAIWKVVERA